MKNFVVKSMAYVFVIIGFIAISISLSLDVQPKEELWLLLKNLLNAIGSIFIVGGIFEILYKKVFLEEIATDFTSKLFLDKDAIQKFDPNNLKRMMINIQRVLSKTKNEKYQDKILKIVNNHLIPLINGCHRNNKFNVYYDYYDLNISVKEVEDEFIVMDYISKYKIVNAKKGKATHTILSRFSFPQIGEKVYKNQDLLKLTVTKDYQDTKNYAEDIKNKKFELVEIDMIKEDDNIRAQKNKDVKKQLQLKTNDGHKELKEDFSKWLVVEEHSNIRTLYLDDLYSFIARAPILNFSIHFTDKTIDHELINPLSLKLFSGLNKIKDDRIHPIYQGDTVSLTIRDELLLPGEGVIISSKRKKYEKNDKNTMG